VTTEMTDTGDTQPVRGWVLYDAQCQFCTSLVRRTRATVEAGGFQFEPLQSSWVRERLAVREDVLLAEMRVLSVSGGVLGGADALVYLARELGSSCGSWWARPLAITSRLPLVVPVLRFAYRWVARHRYCGQGACRVTSAGRLKKEGTR